MKGVMFPLVAAFDNGGKTFDRYTLIFEDEYCLQVYGASENPTHPQGFGMYAGQCYPRDLLHYENPVDFDALPEKVQAFVRMIEREVAA